MWKPLHPGPALPTADHCHETDWLMEPERTCQGPAELPVALLARVLQLLPQSDRLCSCALVCRDWATAAAVVTVKIKHSCRENDMPALHIWLANHGSHLLSYESRRALLQLVTGQLPHLQHLQLEYGNIQLPASTIAAAVAGEVTCGNSISTLTSTGPLLPKLQHLRLPNTTLPSPYSLLQMVQGTQLTSLDLNHVKFHALPESYDSPMQEADRAKLHAGMSALLQHLPGLVVLDLMWVDVGHAAAEQLSAMTRLQDLSLQMYKGMDNAVLLRLPASVTKLHVYDHCYCVARRESAELDTPMSSRSLPRRLQQLTALQHLQLDVCALPPALLENFTHLEHLHLHECALLPAGLHDSYHVEGTATLLSVLLKMTRLQHLVLELCDLDTVTQPLASYAAITASSRLTELRLRPGGEVQPLRPGALAHLFPAGRRMPLLQKLSITAEIQDIYVSRPPARYAMSSHGLARVFSCCPNLQEMDIIGVMPEGSDFSALLQLPSSCTCLDVGGWGFTDAAAPVVAQLTQLKHLEWWCSPGLTDAGLVQLTALGALTCLDIVSCPGLSQEVETEEGGWVQLQSRDDEDPVCVQLGDLCSLSRVLHSDLSSDLSSHLSSDLSSELVTGDEASEERL